MTRLTLLRHAKSIWGKDDNHDIERSLNGQGRREATLMGLVCGEKLPPPDLVLVSPAQRTLETVELFFGAWAAEKPEIIVVENLYLAGFDNWMDILTDNAPHADHLLACSHQPGLGDLASWLCRDFSSVVPPATVISLLPDGSGLERNSAVLDFIGSPGDF